MKNQPRYPIHTHWSEEDGEWVATSPAWPALSALESTPQKSVSELQKVIRAATAANLEAGRTCPETLSTAALKRAVGVIKIAALATRAGIPVQTIHSKIRRGSELSTEESAALHNALASAHLTLG